MKTVASTSSAPRLAQARRELRRRMDRPQRHRLLQGFPMAPLMREAPTPPAALAPFAIPRRPLIVGVIPHPYCNPRVEGCGFCTFSHQRYRNDDARAVTARVTAEVRAFAARSPEVAALPVEALYFGGGTANLTPEDAFDALARALGETFDLRRAEVSLEGAPIYFEARRALLDAIAERCAPARRRISMGVQTFDPETLRRMGRDRFGDRRQIARIVERARDASIATSADLLVSLPHQGEDAIREDLRIAIELGFDQICIYHLVLHEGLGTAWSRDPERLTGLPDADRALAHWRLARGILLDAGFVQTTLTNFERAEVHRGPGRFRYEAASFAPWGHHAIGFGPGGLSTFTDGDHRRGVKHMNESDAARYVERVDAAGVDRALTFDYGPADLELLHLTRGLCALEIDRAAHEARVGAGASWAAEREALEEAGLLVVDRRKIRLTSRGMFYADSVAGLIARRRSLALARDAVGRRHHRDGRRRLPLAGLDDATYYAMG